MFYRISSVKAWIEQLIVKKTSIQQLQKKGECAPPAPPASAISSVRNVPNFLDTEAQPNF